MRSYISSQGNGQTSIMRCQELSQDRLPAQSEVKLNVFLEISAQTWYVKFIACLEIKTKMYCIKVSGREVYSCTY